MRKTCDIKDVLNVLKYYPNIHPPCRIDRILKGYSTSNWVINTDEKKYIIKLFNTKLSAGRVRFIAESQNFIAQSLNCAPLIYRNTSGELFCCTSNGLYAIIYEYVEGQTYSITDLGNQIYYNLGAFLGRIHASYQNFVSDNRYAQKLFLRYSPEERIKSLIKFHEKSTMNAFCIESLIYKYTKLAHFPKIHLVQFKYIPRQVIHGDFYIDNLLFNENHKIVALIDYEQSCRFFKAYELLRAMFYTIYTPSQISRLEYKITQFLSGYLEFSDLSYIEINYMLPLYYWIQLADTYGFEPHQWRKLSFSQLKTLIEFRISLLKLLSIKINQIQEILLDHCYSKIGRLK